MNIKAIRISVLLISVIILFSCNNNDENDSKKHENESQVELIKFEKLKKEKHFEFVCTKDCEGSDVFGEDDVFELYKNKDHLILSKKFSKDKTSFEFLIISSCCQEFGCDYSLHQDTLSVDYFNINGMSCPCTCKYWYRIDIKNSGKKIKAVKINGKLAVDSIELSNLVKTAGIYKDSELFNRDTTFKILTFKKTKFEGTIKIDSFRVDTFNCKIWKLSKEDIDKIITESAPISRNEWKRFFDHWECMYEGKIKQSDKIFDFEINAGGWFTIFEADTFYRFGNYKKENDKYFMSGPKARRMEK